MVGMSVVEPDADLLVLTETGYGKRVALGEFRRKHRGGQGVRLIALEGKKTGLVAAVQQVTEADEELAAHQRRRPGHPDRDQHDQPLFARVRAASSSCAWPRATGSWRIAAFRAGLADRDGMGDDGAPESGGPGQAGPSGGA